MKQAVADQATACFVGVFRRGNKPSVLPREEKRAERKKVGRAWCEPKDF